MPERRHEVSLPMVAPTTEALREAVSAIIRDVTSALGLSDIELGGKLDVHPNTIAAWRNRKNDMGALMIAKIGSKFGAEFIAPYHALYGASVHGLAACDAAPLTEVADALAALTRSKGPKERLDALPIIKDAAERLSAYALSLERFRIAA